MVRQNLNRSNHHQPILVFDFGGVLLDWNPHYFFDRHFNGDARAVDRFLDEIDFYAWNYTLDQGRPFAEGIADLIARHPQYADLFRTFDANWLETMGGPIQPVVAILRAAHAAGYPLFGLSNWSREKFSLVRPRYDFFDCFKAMVISGEVKVAKPDPGIFLRLLEVIGEPAEGCIFIDDSPKNIASAGTLGFQTVLFRSAEQLREELSARGIKV